VSDVIGFIGLGNMGAPLAQNLVNAGHSVVTFDAKSNEQSPAGATFLGSTAEVAAAADVIVLSLPDGKVSTIVTGEIAAAADRRTKHVIDTSTIGVQYSQAVGAALNEAGIGFIDAAVSGGPAGARARTLSVMYAGAPDVVAAVRPVLEGLSDRLFLVGDKAGLAQAIKLANNFLSATYLMAASEAIAFGTSLGIEMGTMLEVLNASSGQSAATTDKFVNQVLPGTFASGFANNLMSKDVALYLEAVGAAGGPSAVGALTSSVWTAFAEAEPGVDFTRIYPFVAGS
jgi:3-hydroxyisobutyrate dehydrogenase-like beta-hydroxyacid dehydrogenase